MKELLNLLDSDFEGKEDMRQLLLNKVPKYGNDIPEADLMVKLATDIYFDNIARITPVTSGNLSLPTRPNPTQK